MMSIMDNEAIARIAAHDLTSDTLKLLRRYDTNDDVIGFLGQLVWQGEMIDCVPTLMDIACNPDRGRYARIVSIRGAMSVGSSEQKYSLWETIADHPGPLDRDLLSELLEWAEPTMRSVELLLRTLECVAPSRRFQTTGIKQALHFFIDRLPLMKDDVEEQPLDQLILGLNVFLSREPFVQPRECHVSKEFAWLMEPALNAVDRLVAARSVRALSPAAISIMQNMPALRTWGDEHSSTYKSLLTYNIPRWRELNDLLYWASVDACRKKLNKDGQTLLDDWPISFGGHLWSFGPEDFERCLDWVRTKKEEDDRLVALSCCGRLFIEADRPAAWLKLLNQAVQGNAKLESALETLLDPQPSPAMEKMVIEDSKRKRKREADEQARMERRADWVRELKENPDRIRHPGGLKIGEFSGDQYHLLLSAIGDRSATDSEDGADWRKLIPEFGEPVALAYRDAAVAHWRAYQPLLRSEGASKASIPYSLMFAMTGLAIEAGEDRAFAQRLTADEARRAFRYVTYQLNGFPSWFEPLYRAHPLIGKEAVTKELIWDLEHCGDQPFHPFLQDILYHAPWLHAQVAPLILDWLREHDVPNSVGLRYCLNILAAGGIDRNTLAKLASGKAQRLTEQTPRWFALWVDTDPRAAVPALERVLQDFSAEEATAFAQRFIVSLLGDRHGNGTRTGAYRNAQDLKRLYILAHRYIRVADDINRLGAGAYSPTLRDDAQDARNTLFNMLASVPGAETYAAIKALEEEHPEPEYRRWMVIKARQLATTDADEPLWTVRQVRDFAIGCAS